MSDAGSIEALFPRRALQRTGGPLYRQLADILRRPITDGALSTGEELPKEAT
ncbi:MAG: GntR family transcriptional regulator, partial [Mesorhizobium amorphae]